MQEKHCICYHYIYDCWFNRATSDSSSCKSFALCVFFSYFHQHLKNEDVPESVYFKTSPMPIPCLRGRNNMEPNKYLIKLIMIISLSFP